MTIEITRDIAYAPPPPVPERALGIEVLQMTKRFGEFAALDQVGLKVPAGSFHALLGENGAGKSTLVKCIMGYYRPDAGDVLVDDRKQAIENPRAAHMLGLGMVYQHFTSVPAMTVTENFVLARSDLPAVFDWRKETRELEAFLARMPFRVPLRAKVSAISAGERQKCEILKQLTILMITHKFREVMAFADEVTILRRGKLAGAGRVAELTPDAMAGMMIGAQELTKSPARSGTFGPPRLEIERLDARNDAGERALHEVSLTVKSGEIVGIAGVSGNGQRQLVEVLAGQREASG